jgi:ABC-2 type transport system ATP-binding protein
LRAKARLGYLPEQPPLYDDMLVAEYLAACARLRAMPPDAVPGAIARCLARCGLSDVGQRLIRHLSKGYQQRLGIAQAIVHEPDVLLLDEPTSGLDPAQIRDVRDLIGELGRDRAIVVSSHILPEVQLIATRIVILHQGRIVHDSPADAAERRMRVRLRHDPEPAALAALAGVRSVARGDGDWTLEVEDGSEAALALSVEAVRAGWGLLELRPNYDALEELFLRLTAGDPVPAA